MIIVSEKKMWIITKKSAQLCTLSLVFLGESAKKRTGKKISSEWNKDNVYKLDKCQMQPKSALDSLK